MKSSFDIFFFEIPCMIHCLIDSNNKVEKGDFQKFWEMIPKANELVLDIELHSVYSQGLLDEQIIKGFELNGILNLAKSQRKDTG